MENENGKQDEMALVEVYEDIERRDEAQIVEFLAGGVPSEYVYGFEDKAGRAQVGMSFAGIRELAQFYGNVRIEGEPKIEDCGDYWRGIAYAFNERRNVGIYGGCHQPKRMKVKDGDQLDSYAYEKCLSKCQRNALKNVLPVSEMTRFIVGYCTKKGIKLPLSLLKVKEEMDKEPKLTKMKETRRVAAQTTIPAVTAAAVAEAFQAVSQAPVTTPDTATSVPQQPAVCPIHNMQLVNGQYGPYCPTRLDTGKFCKGRVPKK